MYSDKQLCEKITSLYPDIGKCGIDVDVAYDQAQKSWVVQLNKEKHQLSHFLSTRDADGCMDGKQCVALGLEIAQLINNVTGKQF